MSGRKVIFNYKEELHAKKFRIEMGMRPIIGGHLKCLKCDRKFYSVDKANNKLCGNCHESNKLYGE